MDAIHRSEIIKAFQKALRVFTLEQFPVQYANTYDNLGNAYIILAEVEDKAANCKRAIKAYKEVLEVCTSKHSQLNYTRAQSNLGFAYHTLASVEDKVENYKKAIKAYRESLKAYGEAEIPEDYQWVKSYLKELLDFFKGK